MNTKTFSDAMGKLSDQYITEALHYHASPSNRRSSSQGIRRSVIAACLCAALAAGLFFKASLFDVVTAPGFLTVTAYAASSAEEVVMEEGIDLPTDYHWSLALNSRPGLPLTLSAANRPELVFDVSVEGGSLLLWDGGQITNLGSSCQVKNDTTIYWTDRSLAAADHSENCEGAAAYLDILLRQEENIVGYAVIAIDTADAENAPAQTYSAKLLQSVSFPQVHGEYQKITYAYAATEMAKIKNEAQTKQP